MRISHLLAATASVFLTAVDTPAQTGSAPLPYSYADLADRALAAPVAVLATVSSAIPLKPAQSPGLAPGHVRLFVEAVATGLIRGPQGLSPQLRYLADVPLDPKGRPPKLKKAEVLLLARPVAGRSGEVQLVAPDAQFLRTPETEAVVRAIITEAVRRDGPPAITGIGGAFHVPGAIPGESETQIFLTTAGNRPISLNVLRRPGEQPQWSVALTEVVDEAAQTPKPDTLLWYRLACGLPRNLPASVVAELDTGAARATAADYALILEQLGRCTRNRPVRTS